MKKRANRDQLSLIIDLVNQLPAAFADVSEQAAQVAQIFQGCGGGTWMEFDERSYGRCRERFHVVRQIRNHPIHGRALFDAINGKRVPA